MAPSKVIVAHARDVVRAKGTDMTSDVVPADCSDVCSTDATHVSSAEAVHVRSAEAAHVGSTEATAHMAASAEATTTVASASAASATAGLRIRRNQTTGKQRGCQNHHHSSFHDILL